jgi:predicted enzyme related to lactoylglutathione lyase
MDIKYVAAGLVVSNLDRAVQWYGQILGRPPDFLPKHIEAVWQVADTASIYLVARPAHAGHGVMAMFVEDLDATLAEIVARGIRVGTIEEMPGAGRKSVITDPDGNALSVIEILVRG